MPIDMFVDAPPRQAPVGAYSAHDFVWRNQRQPYDLLVFQFGNSSHHDYAWAYALRYPGLVVLHDTRLHHARAAFLLRERRADDYRAEFAWSEPGAPQGTAEIAVAGFDCRWSYEWPMVRSLVETARLVAVHGAGARHDLLERLRDADSALDDADSTPLAASTPDGAGSARHEDRLTAIRLGEGIILSDAEAGDARRATRGRYGIAADAILFGCFGGLTPEKRLPQILAALRAILPSVPSAHLLLAGARSAHYDLDQDMAAHQLEPHVTIAGYLETDAAFTGHLAACDVSLNLRWPSARETSGPWLRALAAGVPSVVTDLVHAGRVCLARSANLGGEPAGSLGERRPRPAPDLRRARHPGRRSLVTSGHATARQRRRAAAADRGGGPGVLAARTHSRGDARRLRADHRSGAGDARSRYPRRTPRHLRGIPDRTLRGVAGGFGIEARLAGDGLL